MSGDLISRKKAVQGVRELFSMGDCYCDELSIVGMLNGLTSAEPELTAKVKEGWGLAMCCSCEKRVFPYDKYCSHCGARLEWE